MIILYAAFFSFVTLSVYTLLSYRFDKAYVIERRIQTYFYPDRGEETEENPTFYERVVQPGWKKIKKFYQRKMNRGKVTELEQRLLQAGRPFGWNPVDFNIFRGILMVALPLAAVVLSWAAAAALLPAVLMVLFALFFAWLMPGYYLKMKATQRNKQALKELPDVLDLLTICLESGLGFDAALNNVTARKKGVLIDEFKVCLEELRLGRTRKDALNGLKERLTVDELNAFIYNIIQAEKLGIGMVNVLKIQAEDVREGRRQRAEEAAMKAPIKMMFPLVLFIFPTLFIVLLGPAILQFMDAL
jgi:tight adherence protein C